MTTTKAAYTAGRKRDAAERDHGDGFYTWTEKYGRSPWYYAAQLDAPGGYVVNKRNKCFGYHREALAQIEAWRIEDRAAIAKATGGC